MSLADPKSRLNPFWWMDDLSRHDRNGTSTHLRSFGSFAAFFYLAICWLCALGLTIASPFIVIALVAAWIS